MNATTIVTLVTLATALGWAARPGRAHACSCVPEEAGPAFERAAAVFEGRVLSVQRQTEGRVGPAPVRVELRVVRTWKGADAEEIELTTRGNSAACGYGFVEGESYLVYAGQGQNGKLTASLCSRTRPMVEAEEDLASLGAGITPANPTGPSPLPGQVDEGVSQSAGCGSCAVGPEQGADSRWPLWMVPLACVWLARRYPSRRSRSPR